MCLCSRTQHKAPLQKYYKATINSSTKQKSGELFGHKDAQTEMQMQDGCTTSLMCHKINDPFWSICTYFQVLLIELFLLMYQQKCSLCYSTSAEASKQGVTWVKYMFLSSEEQWAASAALQARWWTLFSSATTELNYQRDGENINKEKATKKKCIQIYFNAQFWVFLSVQSVKEHPEAITQKPSMKFTSHPHCQHYNNLKPCPYFAFQHFLPPRHPQLCHAASNSAVVSNTQTRTSRWVLRYQAIQLL